MNKNHRCGPYVAALTQRKPYTIFANFSNKVNAVENVDVAGADVAEKEALMEELTL